MKNTAVSIADLQRRGIRIWTARRNRSVSFIVRRGLEDLPNGSRALQALNAIELEKTGIRRATANQALEDFRKLAREIKNSANWTRPKPTIDKQTASHQPVMLAGFRTESVVIARGTVRRINPLNS